MLVEVKVPQLSESVAEATLLSWHKKEGEAVARDENLIDIETDKVVLELPAPSDGVLVKVAKGDGSTVVARRGDRNARHRRERRGGRGTCRGVRGASRARGGAADSAAGRAAAGCAAHAVGPQTRGRAGGRSDPHHRERPRAAASPRPTC